MSRLDQLVEQINLLEGNYKLTKYNNFVINVKDDKHFVDRLTERTEVSIKQFRIKYIPKICDAIEINLGIEGRYAFICDKFIVLGILNPYHYRNKDHQLFLSTVLAKSMKYGHTDYQLIIEHLASEFDVHLKLNEYHLETEEEFENYFVFINEGNGLQLDAAKSFCIIDVEKCEKVCIYCGQSPCTCKGK